MTDPDPRLDAAHSAALDSLPSVRGSLAVTESEGRLRPAVAAILAAADAATPPSPDVSAVVTEATPHVGSCAFPDADCDCRALEVRVAVTEALAALSASDASRSEHFARELSEYADGYAESGANGLRLANLLTEVADLLRTETVVRRSPDPRVLAASLREDPPTGDPSTWRGSANVHQHGVGGPPCTLEHEWPPSHLVNSRVNEAGVRAVLARHRPDPDGFCIECDEDSAYGPNVTWPCATARDLADAGVVLPTPGAPR